ncbi:MAG: protein kinase domain-containing protein [Actinomycetota bacterium]
MNETLCPTCGFRNPSAAKACASCGTPLAVTTSPSHVLPPGAKLRGGAYTVGKVLGQGGFGITYLGSDVGLTRPVAVKELFPYGSIRQGRSVLPGGDWTEASFTEAKRKFDEEARVLARFHHPSIVRVYAVFDENETSYMVMEYLRGKSLGGLLEERGGPLPESEATGYIRKVADALAVVHGAGLLHRDIKPDNVVVTDTDRTVLLDFGTAREFAAGKTRKMTAMLTPGYAPLEQYSQQARFGTFTDVYALAATLYHLLTGELPVAALDRIQGVDLPTVRQLNPRVSAATEHAVLQGMQMEVAKRPQTIQAFLALLGGPAAGHPALEPAAQPAAATAAKPASAPRSDAPAPPTASRLTSTPSSAGSAGARTPGERRSRPLRKPVLQSSLSGHSKWVSCVDFSPGSGFLASGSFDNSVAVWDVDSGGGRRLVGHGGPLLGALGAVFTVAFSPDGRTLASGGNDDSIRLWDVRSGKVRGVIQSGGGNVNALAYSPDGSLLAVGGQYPQIELWEGSGRNRLAVLTGHALSIVSLAFSPDGRTLVSGSEDGTAILWEMPSGRATGSLTEHRGAVRSVAFSPDGVLLATGSDDYMVQLWDLRRGVLLSVLSEHGGGVRCVAFSPDGRLLASGGDDLTLKLWDLKRGNLWYTLTGHYGSITTVAFSPDGALLATGSMDTTVQLWKVR